MNEEQQPVTPTTLPTCYKHPDRQTRVSCGRCGRALCPDCMIHGPVGVRCAECLRPPKVEVRLAAPERVSTAITTALAEAMLWVAILTLLAWKLHDPVPNLLISGIAGGLVGWSIWRICGRSSNRLTAWLAFVIGIAIPFVSALAMFFLAPRIVELMQYPVFLLLWALRLLTAMAIGGLFAWLLGTQRHHGGRDLFN